jgi:hypothetical protein
MAGAFFFHVAVVVGANKAPMLCHMGDRWPKLPSSLDAVRNSSVDSSTMFRYGVDTLLRVEPMKMAASLPLLGDWLRPPK